MCSIAYGICQSAGIFNYYLLEDVVLLNIITFQETLEDVVNAPTGPIAEEIVGTIILQICLLLFNLKLIIILFIN